MNDKPPAPKKTGELVVFPGASTEVAHPVLPADVVLQGAMGLGLRHVVICGIDAQGDLFCASSVGKPAEDHFLMSRVAKKMLDSEFTLLDSHPQEPMPKNDDQDDGA